MSGYGHVDSIQARRWCHQGKTQRTLTTMIDQPERHNPRDLTLVRIMYIMLNLVRHPFSS